MKNTRRSVFFGLALLTAISAVGCAKPLDQQNSVSNSSSNSNSNNSNQSNTLKLYSNSMSLKPLGSTPIYATGGTAPYTYSVVVGEGRIDGSTFVAGTKVETVTLRAVDAVGAQAQQPELADARVGRYFGGDSAGFFLCGPQSWQAWKIRHQSR